MDTIYLQPMRREGYRDVWFRIIIALLASHLIVSFGERENLFQLLLMWDYWRSLLISFVIAFLLVTLVYAVTVWLDRHYDWTTKSIQRSSLQIILGLLCPAICGFLFAYVYFAAFGMHILDTPYLRLDFPVIVLMLVVLNLYYLAFYFYRKWRAAELQALQSARSDTDVPGVKDSSTSFIVQQGAQSVPISTSSIAAFYRDGDYNFLKTFDGEKHLISQTLDEIENRTNGHQFFRANRQVIVNYTACKSYVVLRYGKLEIIIEPSINESIVVSQRKAKAFREWIRR